MILKNKYLREFRDAIANLEIAAHGGVPKGGFGETALKDLNGFMFHRLAKILEEYENDYGEHWELETEDGKLVEFAEGTLVATLLGAAELYRS